MPDEEKKLRDWIVANYANPDLTHVEFRVEAFNLAAPQEQKDQMNRELSEFFIGAIEFIGANRGAGQ